MTGRADDGATLEVEGPVATITLRRVPTGLLDRATVAQLARHVEATAADAAVRVVVLRSVVPGYFACHYDVAEILEFDKSAEPSDKLKPFHAMCELLRTMPKLTIAVVEGRAGGGGAEVALSCDLRYADRDAAVFCQPEVALGIIPGGGATERLSRLVGPSRALEIVLGCDDLDAVTAERWGLVNRSLPPDDLWPFVRRLAERVSSFPDHAVVAAKDAVLHDDGRVVEHLLHEAELFRAVLADPRSLERMRWFLDRGGQTTGAEGRLGAFLGQLGDRPDDTRTDT